MEGPQNPETDETVQPPVCVNCGQPPSEGNYPASLCNDCREKFIRFPIPAWIWAFAAAILALMIFGIFKLPSDLSLGMGLEKGRKASEERRYMAAEHALKKVADKLPTDPEANGRLLIAAFYNDHYDLFVNQVRKIQDLKFEDKELFQEIDQVMTAANILLPTDSFKLFSEAYPVPTSTPDTAWLNYFSRNPADNGARLTYADHLFDSNKFRSCDSVERLIMATYPDDFRVLLLAASSKREQAEYDSALFFNQRMLTVNEESVDGLASEARTLLRLKQDARALEVALKGYKLDSNESYAQASLILAYHFSGRAGDRDALIRKAMREAKDSSDKVSVQYALDVISKKEKFRD